MSQSLHIVTSGEEITSENASFDRSYIWSIEAQKQRQKAVVGNGAQKLCKAACRVF